MLLHLPPLPVSIAGLVLAEVNVFGLTLTEAVLLAGFLGYVISLLKDYRPVRQLRSENSDLRRALEGAQKSFEDYCAESERKIRDLDNETARLKRATDLNPIRDQQKKGIEVLESLVAEVKQLDQSLRANTAAVEVLAKRRIIDEAIEGDGLTESVA